MTDLDRTATPTWDSETEAAYSRFIASGGDAATWAKANPELPAPSAPTAPKRPAREGDKALLRWAGAAWSYAAARAIQSIGRR